MSNNDEIQLDQANFPMLWVEPIDAYLHFLPVTKIQMETFLCEEAPSPEFGEIWYADLLARNNRISPSSVKGNNYWQAFVTGILPHEGEAYADWCSEMGSAGFSIPTDDQWRKAYQYLKNQPAKDAFWRDLDKMTPRAKLLLDRFTSIVQTQSQTHSLADQMLMRFGIMEWVTLPGGEWGGLGRTDGRFHSAMFDPEYDDRPEKPRSTLHRMNYYGFRLLRTLASSTRLASSKLPEPIAISDVSSSGSKLLARLSSAAREALLWAEGLRQWVKGSEIYSEYVLAGLYQQGDQITRALLTLFDEEADLRLKLQALANQMTATQVRLEDVHPESTDVLGHLLLSGNLEEVLRQAGLIADERHNEDILASHLLAAFLAVPQSAACRWITDTLGIDGGTLYNMIVKSGGQALPLGEIRRSSTRSLHAISREEALARLSFTQTDFLELSADALVCSTNSGLSLGNTGFKLRSILGQSFQDELQALAPVSVGNAVVTEALGLSIHSVIHVPIYDCEIAKPPDLETVAQAVLAALRYAEHLVKARTLVIPSIGTTHGHHRSLEFAPCIVQTVVSYLEKGSSIEKIIFSNPDPDLHIACWRAAQQRDMLVCDALLEVSSGTVLVGEALQVTAYLKFGNTDGSSASLPTTLPTESTPTISGNQRFALPVGTEEVYCSFQSEGLEMLGDEVVRLTLADATISAEFNVRARRVGQHRLAVEFFYEHPEEHLGLEPLHREVTTVTVNPAPSESARDLSILPVLDLRFAPQPDWVVLVAADINGSMLHLRYRLTSHLPQLIRREELVGDAILNHNAITRWQTLLERELALSYASSEAAHSHLSAIGAYLYDQLFPVNTASTFRELFWQTADRFPHWSCLIVEAEPLQVPWELVRPYRPGATALTLPWGARCRLARWSAGLREHLPGEVPFRDLALVSNNLPDAEVWAQLWHAEAASSLLPVIKPATALYGLHFLRQTASAPTRLGLLRRDGPFSTEGEPADEDRQALKRGRLDLWHKRPVVAFSLLKRETGSYHAEQIGLIAEKAEIYLRAGASAAVGTWWPVQPAVDQLFWTMFYHLLERHVTLGEAVWRARLEVRQAFPDSPDWLAYVLYGDPRARPYVPESSEGYASLECLNPETPFRVGRTYTFEARISLRPPIGYQDRLLQVEKLPPNASALFLAPTLQTEWPHPTSMTPVGRTTLRALANITPTATGEHPVLVQFLQGDEQLKTMQLMLSVQEAQG